MSKIGEEVQHDIDALLDKARDLIDKNNKISPDRLVQELEISSDLAIKLIEMLEKEAIV